jgi:hypothetical protein
MKNYTTISRYFLQKKNKNISNFEYLIPNLESLKIIVTYFFRVNFYLYFYEKIRKNEKCYYYNMGIFRFSLNILLIFHGTCFNLSLLTAQ